MLVKGWTEFCAKHDWLNIGDLRSPSLQKHIFENGSFGGKPCRRHLILWQLSHLKFSSLFLEIKATWAKESFLNWGFDRSIALAAESCNNSVNVTISSAYQFSFALFVDMCSFEEHPWRRPNISKGKHFRMESVAFSCQPKPHQVLQPWSLLNNIFYSFLITQPGKIICF